MVALDLDIDIRQSRILRQPKEFSADERVKSCSSQSRYNLFKRPLHSEVTRVVPQQLAVQVLQQDDASGLRDPRHFRHGPFLFLQVFEQHAAVHQVEAIGRQLHRVSVPANEFHTRILAIILHRLLQAVSADVYARCPNRRIQFAYCA